MISKPVYRYEFNNSDVPYSVPRFAKSSNSKTVLSFNYNTFEYDRLTSLEAYEYIKFECSQIHKTKELPNIYNIQVSTKEKRKIDIYNCYICATSESDATRVIKHTFSNVCNIAVKQAKTQYTRPFQISFQYKEEKQKTVIECLAPNLKKAKAIFKIKYKLDLEKRNITNITFS